MRIILIILFFSFISFGRIGPYSLYKYYETNDIGAIKKYSLSELEEARALVHACYQKASLDLIKAIVNKGVKKLLHTMRKSFPITLKHSDI